MTNSLISRRDGCKKIVAVATMPWLLLSGARAITPQQRAAMLGQRPKPAATPSGVVYVYHEDFETATTGYDSGKSYSTAGNGTINPVYTPALIGSQSLSITAGTTNTSSSCSFDVTDPINVFLAYNRAAAQASGTKTLLQLRTSAGGALFTLSSTSDGRLNIVAGTASVTTTNAISNATLTYLWIYYASGSGANAQGSIAFSTDGVKPTSGNAFKNFTNGNTTTQVGQIWYYTDSSSAMQQIYDKVRVSASTLGNADTIS